MAPLLRQRILDYLALRGVALRSEARLFVRMRCEEQEAGVLHGNEASGQDSPQEGRAVKAGGKGEGK